jgi:hypothetical protein
MLIDSYTSTAASAVAANTFMRSAFAAGLPFAAPPLFHNLGVDWWVDTIWRQVIGRS